jgi:hypothetical protein
VEGVRYFLALAHEVALGMTYFWPLTLLLAACWVTAFVITPRVPARGRWRLLALGCLPPVAFPVAILAVGAAFPADPPWVMGVDAPALPDHLITALLLVQLPLALLAIRRWQGQQPAVAASWVCCGYVSLGASFVSTMSVTGVWL